MDLSERVRRLAPSYALGIHYRYKEMLRQGKDCASPLPAAWRLSKAVATGSSVRWLF